MSSTVDLYFRYLRSDYVRAVRANFGSRTRIWCDIIVSIIVAGLGVYLLKSQELRTGIVFIGLAAVFVVVLIAGLTVIPTITFSHTPKFHDEYSLAFSQEGIHFRTSQIDSQLKWNTYLRVLIDAHSYLLYYGPRSFTIVPKRVFQSSDQQQAFEHLLAQNIPRIIRRRAYLSASAVPVER
jgi:hypothetical protein